MKNKKREDYKYQEKSIEELLNIAKNNFEKATEIFFDILKEENLSRLTEFLAKFIQQNNHIYTLRNDKITEIWIYQEGIYIQQGKSIIKEQLRKIMKSVINQKLLSDIILKIELDTMIDIEKFFSFLSLKEYLHLIPIKNGLFNINTKKIEPFNPQIIFTTKIPVNYEPTAKCPIIEEFLKDVLETEENKNLFYEIAGFCLYRDYFIEKAIIFDGFGRNGKSKTQELLRNFIGIENSCAVPLSQLTEDSFSVSELFNKHINIAGDLSNTNLKDTATFQKTVGRDFINAKRKFLTDVKFINSAKHIFSTNELPKTYATHKGFWEKWILIQFNNTFIEKKDFDKLKTDEEKQNKKLLNPNILKSLIIQEELDGLFLKALEGLERVRKNQQFSYNKNSEQIKDNWIRKSDSFFSFATENLESTEDYNLMIPKGEIRKIYYKYCQEHKIKGCSDSVIKITLQEQFGVDEYRNHEQQTFWTGIKIKDDSKYKIKSKEQIKKEKDEKVVVTYEKIK